MRVERLSNTVAYCEISRASGISCTRRVHQPIKFCDIAYRVSSFAGLTIDTTHRALRRATHGGCADAPGRAQALNPLFIAAISLGKYSEARGHIDVACVHVGGALIITYHARKVRYASYARGQKRPSHSLPFLPLLANIAHTDTNITFIRHRRCCIDAAVYLVALSNIYAHPLVSRYSRCATPDLLSTLCFVQRAHPDLFR